MSTFYLVLAWILLACFISGLPPKVQRWVDRLWAGLFSGLVIYWTFMFSVGKPQVDTLTFAGVLIAAIFFIVISKDEKAYLK